MANHLVVIVAIAVHENKVIKINHNPNVNGASAKRIDKAIDMRTSEMRSRVIYKSRCCLVFRCQIPTCETLIYNAPHQ